MRTSSRLALFASLALLQLACGDEPQGTPGPAERRPGERAPLTADCDPIDDARCALPWPSNAFTRRDEGSATGIRVALGRSALPNRDQVDYLNLADGFSRLSPVLTAFKGKVDPATLGSGDTSAMRLLVAQPGAPDEGQSVPLRLQLVPSSSERYGEESLLVGFPLRPLGGDSDHVVVVLDSLRAESGEAFEADRLTRLSLGLAAPENDEEKQRVAYHAPTRALLKSAGIDAARVLRVWDFTTRTSKNARSRLELMRHLTTGAVARGEVSVAIDEVNVPGAGPIAAIVIGRLVGVPYFRTEDGQLSRGDEGLPVAAGLHDAPFRVVIPSGTGDYRVTMYGHGTGGNLRDAAFDTQVAEGGLAKVSGLFYGWDDKGIADTLLALDRMQESVAKSTAGLMQSLADLSAVEEALGSVLGEALAAPKLKDVDNPAAGRRPNAAEPFWTGGSLGGTLGLVYSGLSPRVKYAVLNVPGAGWTHFVPGSDLFNGLEPILRDNYASPLDFWLTLMASQLAWDDIDGGNWTGDLLADGSVYLVQESMGDPILPNPGSELCAAAVGALHLGAVLAPVPGLSLADVAVGTSALTQFRVPEGTTGLNRHGFADRAGPAGDAARAQITAFLESALTGAPRIELPELCRTNVVANSCDFSAAQ